MGRHLGDRAAILGAEVETHRVRDAGRLGASGAATPRARLSIGPTRLTVRF